MECLLSECIIHNSNNIIYICRYKAEARIYVADDILSVMSGRNEMLTLLF
jgi:hypothetical protein